ncbi:helix-turn-helix domain-containing protein [Legionella longbeachae]|uniref:helix-turn-helix domain-containing protein n=1 Tax=Legionella longbeachae TaxID=450 RepID=UPI00399CA7D2
MVLLFKAVNKIDRRSYSGNPKEGTIKHSIQSICKMVGVGKTTLYKYINQTG